MADESPKRGASDMNTRTALTVGLAVTCVVFVGVVLVAGLVLADRIHVSDAKSVAALLTLLGALLSAAVTTSSLLLKNAIDLRTSRLTEQSELNRQREASAAEERLKLETAIKTVELLTMPDGSPAPATRQAGALLVISSPPLRQLALALALLDEIWETAPVSDSIAVWIIDQAFQQSDFPTQANAVSVLREHAERLVSPDGHRWQWPSSAWTWPPTHVTEAALRVGILEALLLPLTRWTPESTSSPVVSGIMFVLDSIQKNDPDEGIKRSAMKALSMTIEWYEERAPQSLEHDWGGGTAVNLRDIRNKIDARIAGDLTRPIAQSTHALIEQIRSKWWPDDAKAIPDLGGQPVPPQAANDRPADAADDLGN